MKYLLVNDAYIGQIKVNHGKSEGRQVKRQQADKSSEFLEMWSSRLLMS